MLNKVPQVTIAFWVIKILSTTVGETGADFLAVHVGWGTTITDLVMAALLAVALVFQFRAEKYIPWRYWLTVVLISIVGTQITDLLTDRLEVSLYVSSAFFAALLALVFFVWWIVEGTLSVNEIKNRRREIFYWSAILCTFALGTAAGDLATEQLGLGFRVGTVAFACLIAVAAAGYYFGLNSVLVFWTTYILTRPLGASLGDLLSQPVKYGGLGLGTIQTSLIFLALIAALVTYLTIQNPDTEPGVQRAKV
jgi:uncharacterized membrane-anchored protein